MYALVGVTIQALPILTDTKLHMSTNLMKVAVNFRCIAPLLEKGPTLRNITSCKFLIMLMDSSILLPFSCGAIFFCSAHLIVAAGHSNTSGQQLDYQLFDELEEKRGRHLCHLTEAANVLFAMPVQGFKGVPLDPTL